MEKDQISHIEKNLVSLLKNTRCSEILLAGLISKNVITSEDRAAIKSVSTDGAQAYQLYEILYTRKNSYDALVNCLIETSQTGALHILKHFNKDIEIPQQLKEKQTKNGKHFQLARSKSLSVSQNSQPTEELTHAEQHDTRPSRSNQIQIVDDLNQPTGTGRSKSLMYKGNFCGFDVAVKVYDLTGFEIAKLMQSVNTLKELDHENILRFHSYEIVNNNFLIAYEFCSASLDKCIESATFPLSIQQILKQTTKGVKYLHDNNIVHGRLIPKNVLLKKRKNDTYIVKLSGLGYSIGSSNKELNFADDIDLLGSVFESAVNSENQSNNQVDLRVEEVTTVEALVFYELPENVKREIVALIQIMRHEHPIQRPDCSEVLRRLKSCFAQHNVVCTDSESPIKNNELSDTKSDDELRQSCNVPVDTTFSSTPNISLDTTFFPNINLLSNVLEDSGSEIILGIDFGTDKCRIAIANETGIHHIPNKDGKNTISSCVYFKDDGSRLIGHEAKRRAFQNPRCAYFEFKPTIGLPLNDALWVHTTQYYLYDVLADTNTLYYLPQETPFTPVEVSAILIDSCVEAAERYLNIKDIRQAVITIPAYFTEAQKSAIKEAGLIAGLDTVYLLYEPAAAAIAYAHNQIIQEPKRILIFDLGGGTFNVAIVDVREEGISIVGYGGDTSTGGNRFHLELYKHCINTFNELHNTQIQNRSPHALRTLSLIRKECKIQKKKLNFSEYVSVNVPNVFDSNDMDISVTREQYHEMTKDLVEQLIQIVTTTLDKSGVTKDTLDDIVLVGGSTRTPMIRERLEKFFPGTTITTSFCTNHTVARGAALHGAYLRKAGLVRSQTP